MLLYYLLKVNAMRVRNYNTDENHRSVSKKTLKG